MHYLRIVRADGPDGLLEGLGTSYIVYDWSEMPSSAFFIEVY